MCTKEKGWLESHAVNVSVRVKTRKKKIGVVKDRKKERKTLKK